MIPQAPWPEDTALILHVERSETKFGIDDVTMRFKSDGQIRIMGIECGAFSKGDIIGIKPDSMIKIGEDKEMKRLENQMTLPF